MKKVLSILLIIIILGFTIYLLLKIPHKGTSVQLKEESGVLEETIEEWMGIFINDQRVGYSFTKVKRFDDGLEVENKTEMTIYMMQEVTKLSTQFFGQTDRDYALKEFAIEIFTAGHSTKVEGKIMGNELTITTYSQGIRQTQKKNLKEKPYFPDAVEQLIKRKNLKPGDEIFIPYFDPTTQSSAQARLKVYPVEDVKVLQRTVKGMKVEINFLGIVSYIWLDKDYRVIKESTPSLRMEMIPLTKEEALKEIKPDEAFDLLSFFSVKLDKPIPHNKEISKLRLKLSDISIEGLDLNDDYQRLLSENPVILESTLPIISELDGIEIPIPGMEEFLKPSVYVQCDHPEIIAQAKRIVGNEKNAVGAVKKLTAGVYGMLKKIPTPSMPSALDVLKTKEGDCNEHSILFTALARALGIPTKVYVGLVNLYGDAYFYHAWCAVYLGKWIPVDPTFNQFPADVRHLKLKEGEISDWAEVMKVVGRLRIEVVEYR